jgi:hypothetical protein
MTEKLIARRANQFADFINASFAGAQDARKSPASKIEFSEPPQLDPRVQEPAKINHFHFSEIHVSLRHPASQEGRYGQSSRNVERGMRWTRLGCTTSSAEADGESVWS